VNSGTEPKQFKHLKIYVKTKFLNSVSLTMRIQGRASNENMAYIEAVLLLMLLKYPQHFFSFCFIIFNAILHILYILFSIPSFSIPTNMLFNTSHEVFDGGIKIAKLKSNIK